MASTPKFFDRVKESTTTTGTGTLTLLGAVTGFQAFTKLGNGNSCLYCIQAVDANGNPSGDWEIGVGTYTLAGTTLSRDAMIDSSNAGAPVNFGAGTKHVWIDFPSSIAQPDYGVCQGRLTTESGVAVSTSDRTAQGTIYFTPYLGNCIGFYHNGDWYRVPFVETSLALTVTSGKQYTVFGYFTIVAGGFILTLELSAAWTNDTTPADALVLQDGIQVKSGTPTKRVLGTIRASGANVTEDSLTKRFVYNSYNHVRRRLYRTDSTSHTYNGGYRQWNNDAANKVEWVQGDAGLSLDMHILGEQISALAGSQYAICAAGLDTTSSNTLPFIFCYLVETLVGQIGGAGGGSATFQPGLGYHYMAAMESTASTGTQTFNSMQLSGALDG